MSLAFGLSLVPGLLGWLPWPGAAPSGASQLALALLPWLALAGLPRVRPGGARALAVVGAMLPALALAAALDRRAGLADAGLLATAAWGTLLVLALAHAADRGRGALHGALWLVLVPGLASLAYARAVVGSLELARGAGALLAASPLVWALRAAPEDERVAALGWPLGPLVVVLVLVLAASLERRRGPEDGA